MEQVTAKLTVKTVSQRNCYIKNPRFTAQQKQARKPGTKNNLQTKSWSNHVELLSYKCSYTKISKKKINENI